MRTNLGPFLLVVLLGAFVWVGCSEEPRTSAKVETLNQNGPLYSDVYDLGDDIEDPSDDFIPADLIEVTIALYPADEQVELLPGGPFGGIKFTSYSVEYSDPKFDGGVDLDKDGIVDIKNFTAPMNLWVPVWGKSTTFVAPMPIAVKTQSPSRDLRFSGNSFRVSARITFYGTEDNSDREVVIHRGLDIFIADFGDM